MTGWSPERFVRCVSIRAPMLAGPAGQVVGAHLLDRAERRGAGDRVAAVRPAEAADVHARPSRSARPVTAASGSPPAMPLAAVTRSGTTPSSSQANQSPVRQKPVWISSAMNRMPLAVHHSEIAGRKPGAGTTKPPSPWIGSIATHARLAGADLLVEVVDRAGRRLLAGEPVAQRVGHRRPVDLARERPEALLVGHVLGRHRHREVGAPVVGVVEDGHRVPAGRRPGRSSRRSRRPRRRS